MDHDHAVLAVMFLIAVKAATAAAVFSTIVASPQLKLDTDE